MQCNAIECYPANIEPNDISFNAAIAACDKGGEWGRALDLLDEVSGRSRRRTCRRC